MFSFSKLKTYFNLGWLKKIAFAMAIGFGVVWISLLIALVAAHFLISEKDVRLFVEKMCAEQTGGRCQIGAITWRTSRGLRVDEINIYPPLKDDLRGYAQGGAVSDKPLLSLKKLRWEIHPFEMLLGKITMPAFELERPRIFVERASDYWNYQGILDYRAKHFPATPAQPQVTTSPPLALDQLIPKWLVTAVLPFTIRLHRIGFSDLEIEIDDKQNDAPMTASLKGLSVLFFADAFANQSKLVLQVKGERNGKVAVAFDQGGKENIAADVALDFKWQLKNLFTMNVDFKIESENAIHNQKSLPHFLTDFLMVVQTDSDLQQIQITDLRWNVLEAIEYRLLGEIGFPKNNFDKIDLQIEQNLSTNFAKLEPLVNFIVPKAKLAGSLNLKKLNIKSLIDLTKPMDPKNQAIPEIEMDLRLKNVGVQLPDMGVVVTGIESSLGATIGTKKNSTHDLNFDFNIGEVQYSNLLPGKQAINFLMGAFKSNLQIDATYPKSAIPKLKWDIASDRVVAKVPGVDALELPFKVEINAAMKSKFKNIVAEVGVQVANLTQSNLKFECERKCAQLNVDGSVQVDSLANVYAFVRPTLESYVSLRSLPDRIQGAFVSKIHVESRGEPFKNNQIQAYIDGSESMLSLETHLKNIEIEKKDAYLVAGFNQDIAVKGDWRHQELKISHRLAKVELVQAASENLKVEGVDFSFAVNNRLAEKFNIQTGRQQLSPILKSNIKLKSLNLGKILPTSLANIEMGLLAKVLGGERVLVDSIFVKVPDFGLRSDVNAKMKVDFNNKLHDMTTRLAIVMDQRSSTSGVANISTKGRFSGEVNVASADLLKINIDGKLDFQDLFVRIIDEKSPDKKVFLAVDSLNGKIPFRQTIDTSSFTGAAKKKQLALKSEIPKAALDDSQLNLQISQQKFEQVSEEYFKSQRDVIRENPNQIEIVDFQSVRPFKSDRDPVRIKRIKFRDLEISNLEFDIEVKQNWFAINQYFLEFLNGKIYGEMILAFDPLPQAFKTSVHMTKLDTRKLLDDVPKLKARAQGWSLTSDPYLEGNFHLQYDVPSNSMDGGMEITRIGQEQLKMILFYMDPKEEQPTITQIRSVLNFGEVRHVSVPIRNGFIGVSVDVRLLGAPIPTPEIRGFPIANLSRNFINQKPPENEEILDIEEENEEGLENQVVPMKLEGDGASNDQI